MESDSFRSDLALNEHITEEFNDIMAKVKMLRLLFLIMIQYFTEIMTFINLEMAKKGAVMVKVRFIFLSDLTH